MPATPTPRLTLAERRKAETRLDIARTAARLFAENGTAAVTAEQIAAESGIGLRTFYRYARTKEDAVEPMLAAGAQRWLAAIAAGPHRLPTLAELETAAVASMTADGNDDDLEITRGLLRAMDGDPALRDVWHRINMEGERELRSVLADLTGPDTDPLRLRLLAAAAAGAIRIALEQWAAIDSPSAAELPAALVSRCLHALAAGV
ncbi:TetR/AcrR family transcriptional regulator [Nocardia inohanensis]|uniref:TetR/AcrR family transcriptional regulator n=1 Tax=Nocardia inohanensis TaxID=209246 RepID=UPI00082F1BD2|nr:TetR/AcrR family transcriptional regulator [Nocardia inohanensis]